MASRDAVSDDSGTKLARKMRRHLLPLLFLLYVVAYLDRINVGFAALDMNRELGLSSAEYGLLSGIFFSGYFLFEVPSNLILHRVGARRWIAQILLTWGLVAVLTAFVNSAPQLYAARFLLGVAEAGFFPGILYYLTYWFRQRHQAQTIALFLTALPTASIIGGPLSGWILDHVHGYGLSSWRWLLIIEALPAIAGGLLTYRLLPDRPADASFLTAREKLQVREALAAEAAARTGGGELSGEQLSVRKSFTHPRILQLTGIHFLVLSGLYVAGFWMPQSIREVAVGYSNTVIGILVMVPNAVSLLAMIIVSRSSARHNERQYHAAFSLLLAAAGLYFVDATPLLGLRIALWSAVASGLVSYLGPFWACPGEFLHGRSAASALAFINSVGSLGSFFSLSLIGVIAEKTGSLDAGFHAVGVALVVAAALLSAQKLYRSPVGALAAG